MAEIAASEQGRQESMAPTLLGLPRELRDHIYEFVWCSPTYVRVAQEYLERHLQGFREREVYDPSRENPTFPEAVAFPYPPREPTEVSESDNEASSDSAEEGNWTDDLSASEEDEEEVRARVAALATPLPAVNDEEDSTDDEELSDSDEDDQDDDSTDEEEPSDSDKEDEYDYTEDVTEPLVLATPVHTGLLSVNKQISAEATPVFYRNITLVLDGDGASCIQFIRKLPRATRRRIVSMAITNAPLMGDDGPSRRAWSNTATYRGADGLTLVTPFAATLAKNFPNLEEFSLFVPWSGHCYWYCSYAITELSMILKYDRIQQLNHVFLGEQAAEALQLNSEECYKQLMGGLADGTKLAKHEFQLRDPHPTGFYTKAIRKKGHHWMRREEAFSREHAQPFLWEWVDRDIDMGSCGNVQAVIACYNDE